MFGKKPKDSTEEIERLKKALDAMSTRVTLLERDCAPIRIGKLEWISFYQSDDHRPKVSLHEVAVKLMEHCGLTFERIAPTAEQIVVKKSKK